MELVKPDFEGIERAAEALRDGEIVAYPTESVYGLGVDPFNNAALEKLYETKARDTSNPVLMIVSQPRHMHRLVGSFSDETRKYMKAFWPGPLSMLFPVGAELPELLIGPHKKICLRMTSHPVAAGLCTAFGGPITSTSANRSFENPAQSPDEIKMEGIAVCIDGGIADSTPSTIYDPETGQVLREGAIKRVDLVNASF